MFDASPAPICTSAVLSAKLAHSFILFINLVNRKVRILLLLLVLLHVPFGNCFPVCCSKVSAAGVL